MSPAARPHAVDPPTPGGARIAGDLVPAAPLPLPLTPLVGREVDVTLARKLLRQPEVRLLTLTGPGGVGKSRVAIEAADGLHDVFEDGVRLVRLASVHDADLVLPTIAAGLGLPEAGRLSPLEAMQARLRGRSLLLLLDNFEQVIAAAPLLADLLRACPAVKALITSRQRLRLRGERVVEIEPLAGPAPASEPGALLLSPAVSLFAARARDASPEFAITAGNAAAVAEIVRRLDGLPLAIELAAARIGFLGPEDLASRLAQRLPVLTDGPRDLPDRLRTMRDAIAWSYDLLSDEERALFRRLAVFAGGFTLEAAECVGGDGHDTPTVLTLIGALVEKSLLRPVPGPPGSPPAARFTMLETEREFAREQLAAVGEAALTQRRHAEHVAGLAEQAWPATNSWTDQDFWFDLFEIELDNVRTALEWSLHDEPSMAVRLAGALLWFWHNRGHRREGRRWLHRALEAAPDDASTERARAVFASGFLAHWQDDDAKALAHLEESLDRWRSLEDGWGQRATLLFLGIVSKDGGDYAQALPLLEQSLDRCRADRDDDLAAYVLAHLATARWGHGDTRLAVRQLSEALAGHRRRGDAAGITMALGYLCLIAVEQGAADDALALLSESVDLCRTITSREDVAFCLATAAVLASARQQPQRAARLFGAERRLRVDLGNPAKEPELGSYLRGVDRAINALGEAAYVGAWEAGQQLTVAGALDEAAAVAHTADASAAATPAATGGLTPREIEVLRLVATGRTNAQVADELFITAGTARIHVSNILGKLGASTRTEAAAIARERDLL